MTEEMLAALQRLLPLLNWAERVSVPYLFSSLMLATIVWWHSTRGRQPLRAYLFSWKLWWHPSARLDYLLFLLRGPFAALLVVPSVLGSLAIATWVAGSLGRLLGPVTLLDAHAPLTVLAGSIFVFTAEDLGRFLLHRMAHAWAPLWRLHKVHHEAEVLTPFTVHRVHPIEAAMFRVVSAISIGLAAGLWSWLCGGPVRLWEILGVQALSLFWNIAGANLRHSHVWITYPRWLSHLLISPAQHQVHHLAHPRYSRTNFGAALAVWDWLLGSLHIPMRRARISFGLPRAEAAAPPTHGLLDTLLLRDKRVQGVPAKNSSGHSLIQDG
jgi:sterol desaturase/sphingolipid hydroxylase (fatty acid hydroxylase superfamily)